MLNVLKRVTLFALLTVSSVVMGQKGSKSPYSAYGLGELNVAGYPVFSSMGGVSMGNMDSTVVNSNNPASYAFIGRNRPIFQIGLNGRSSVFSTEEGSTNQAHFGLNQFQLGLPIGTKWGAAVSVRPYSFSGYEITKYDVNADTDTVMQTVNEGSGGIRMASLGVAYKPVNFSKIDTIFVKQSSADSLSKEKNKVAIIGKKIQVLSIGVNGNYMFGTSKQIRSTEFIPSSFETVNSRVEDGLRVSGISPEFGVNYQFGFKSDRVSRTLSLGASYSPAIDVKAFQDLFAYSYTGSFYRGESANLVDSIQFIEDNQGVISKPESIKAGFEYQIGPNGDKNSLLKISGEVNYEKWSSFETNFSNVVTNGGLKDRTSMGIGLEWSPYTGYRSRDNTTPTLGKLRYRIGFNYTQTELLVKNSLNNDVGINNYGMSFGLGIPIVANNSNTNINFGASLGNLGSKENGLIQEQYLGFFVGLSITPGYGNYWFLKRKYD